MIAKPKIVQGTLRRGNTVLPRGEQPTLADITPLSTEQPQAPGVLLTPAELAARLAVGESWVREKVRERARLRDRDPLPRKKLGKYIRFSWPEVEAWLTRQGS
jgi:predicted DNA-binding transcriptional regulator AlpA